MIREPVYDKERVLAHKVLVNTLYALGAQNYALLPHLYEMHRPIGLQSPKIDIVCFFEIFEHFLTLIFRFLCTVLVGVHFEVGARGKRKHFFGRRFF